MEKLFYSIGEVAEMLGESISLVRFWTNSFSRFIKPERTAKGNRQYSPRDIETLRHIHHLVKDKGLTLEGAARELAGDRKPVEDRVRVLETLKEIRAQLVEIRKSL